MRLKQKRAQSTLEYAVVLVAIASAVIAGVLFITPRDRTRGVGRLMEQAGGRITDATDKLRRWSEDW